MSEIMREYLGYTEKKLDGLTRTLFQTLDDDHNELADALEFLSALAVVSGMSMIEKIKFIFGIYDFDESGHLTVDEMILALRSTVSGLCKLSDMDMPLESEIERVAVGGFENAKSIDGSTINRDVFVRYCQTTPEITSWLEFYGDIADPGRVPLNSTSYDEQKVAERLVDVQAEFHNRTGKHLALMDIDAGRNMRLQIEEEHSTATAQPQWKNVVAFLEPKAKDELRSTKSRPAFPPDVSLDLEWVHGFNARRRQNVWYTARGELVYSAGSLGVVLDVPNRKQRFFNVHTDLIECVRVHTIKNETFAATGEIGVAPKIMVWSTTSFEVLSMMRGLHQVGVMHLDFSADGERLVSIGATSGVTVDQAGRQLVVVYDWRRACSTFSSYIEAGDLILDVRFLKSRNFATCGRNHIDFWWQEVNDADRYRRERGLLGNKIAAQPQLCAAYTGMKVVSGAASGHILEWEGRTCVESHKVHASAVTALIIVGDKTESHGVASASTDGHLQLWTASLEPRAKFDIALLGPTSHSITSISWDTLRNKIAVATDSAQLYEISAKEGYNLHEAPIVVGHFEWRLSGLAAHPRESQILCTVGDDKWIHIWDAKKRREVRSAKLDTMARCCAYSRDGAMIAVGLGGVNAKGQRQRKDGAYVVLDAESLTVMHEARDSKYPITAIAFSPDGLTLVLGSEDRCLYLYNVSDFTATTKCRGHKGRIMQVDWSKDSKLLQSTDDVGELLFWEVDSGEQRPPRMMCDVQWETHSCVFGWSVQGVWSDANDGCLLTGSARLDGIPGKPPILATTDNYGRIQLWKYPANSPSQIVSRDYYAHAAPGGSCTFARDGQYLWTTGRGDGVVAQWLVVSEAQADHAKFSDEKPDSVEQADYLTGAKHFTRPLAIEASARYDMTAVFQLEERGADEDYAPIRPWQRTIIPPSRPPPENHSMPPDRLELEWIHGLRSHDVRSHVRYSVESGEIVYPAGTVVVCLNPHERRQRFFRHHMSDVMSIAVHHERPIAATGEGPAALPTISVWNYSTMTVVRSLRGFHRRAVPLLAFSTDERGKYLITVGLDDYHSAIMFEWETGTVICKTATCTQQKPLALISARQGSGFGTGVGFVACGENFVRFWRASPAGRNATSTPFCIGTKGRLQPFLCLGWLGSALVAGTLDGAIYRFSGSQLDKSVSAHSGSVNTLFVTNEGLVSGGRDGFVRLWTVALEIRLEIDMLSVGSVQPNVRSVCWDDERHRVVVATMGAEIWELDASDGSSMHQAGPALRGHFDGDLWGLATHPSLPQYATTGDDKILRIWSILERTQVRSHRLDMMSRACAFSPDGKQIAIGFGSPTRSKVKQFDGKFVILDLDDFAVLHETRDSQKWITEIKYSPSGELLAVGSWDTRIYIYVLDDGILKLQNMITQHNSNIGHFDFSLSTGKMQFLQSNCGAHELCFFEADTGMYIPAASRLRDVKWATQTCPKCWATQGAWPAQHDSTEVTTVDCALKSRKPVLAVADNFGRVRLYRYPCTSSLAKCKEYRGHSADVTKVRWAGGDSHLISCSATDRCIFQWKHVVDDLADERAEIIARVAASTKENAQQPPAESARRQLSTAEDVASRIDTTMPSVDAEDNEDDEATDSTNRVQKRAWLLAVVPPNDAGEPNVNAPNLGVRLEWVHGCQTEVSRSAVVYNSSCEIIYPVSKLAVIYSPSSHTQRYYFGHRCPVVAIAVSPGGRFVASGEMAARPTVHIWDSRTASNIVAFPPYHRSRIRTLTFSPSGNHVASIGADNDGSLALWFSPSGEWYDAYLQVAGAGGNRLVRFVAFANLPRPQSDEHYDLMTGGHGHVYFWMHAGVTLASVEPLWDNADPKQEMLCCAAVVDRFVTGSANGDLFVWNGRSCEKVIGAHEQAVESIHAAPVEAGFVTGGRDGLVKLWSVGFKHVKTFDISEASIPPLEVAVTSVYIGITKGKVSKILVGALSSETYEIATETGSIMLFSEGHFQDELWACVAHPKDPDVFATAGDDFTIRIWSVNIQRILRKAKLDGPVRALAWSPDGKRIVAGMGGTVSGRRHPKDGVFLILNSETLDIVHEGRDSRHWIRCVKYSPDGAKIAIGSMDHKIYLYDAHTTELLYKCTKHNSYVTHMDFSADSSVIQSDAADFEHLYHSVKDGSHIRLPSQLKDTCWATWSCIYGWPVQGCWPALSGDKGRDNKINVTSTNATQDLRCVATGDENGDIRLHRYPSLPQNMSLKCTHSHTSSVSCVSFSASGAHLYTIGKHDRSIAVWRITYQDE